MMKTSQCYTCVVLTGPGGLSNPAVLGLKRGVTCHMPCSDFVSGLTGWDCQSCSAAVGVESAGGHEVCGEQCH